MSMASYNPPLLGHLPPGYSTEPGGCWSPAPPPPPPPVLAPLLPLGVFWDIENCCIPHGKSALNICKAIRDQPFFRGYREMQFTVVCDTHKEQARIVDEIDKAQVDVMHVASNKKNAADDKLKQLMRRFADIHRSSAGARIVLISGDRDFAADLADYKRRMLLSVILLHTNNCPADLLLAASEHYNFQVELETEAHSKVRNHGEGP